MSAQCYEHRFGYCTNAKTCFNVHFRPILAERCLLLGTFNITIIQKIYNIIIQILYNIYYNKIY